MSFLIAALNQETDVEYREELQDRVDLILHKIKFMDKVPVICLDVDNKLNNSLNALLEAAGAVLQSNPEEARVLIYADEQCGMLEMMGIVPAGLQSSWPAVQYNRVYLFDDHALDTAMPEALVAAFEDLAELLYPGSFVFGNEGKTWTAFGV
jgi:hypothetical protein